MLISSRSNEKVKQFIRVKRNILAHHPWFVVEGEKLLREAAASPHRIVTVFVLQSWESRLGNLPSCEIHSVTAEVMQKLTSLRQPTWVVALCRREGTPALPDLLAPTPWLILDGLQDPGNVGTIFRAAEAFGSPPLILLPPSPAPFHEKVIRASAGSVLRVPYWRPADHQQLLDELREREIPLWLLEPAGETALDDVKPGAATAFLVGNEGHGPSPALAAMVQWTIRIPMAAGVDSLNAATAAAILLHHLFPVPSAAPRP
ncbi:MAG: RNA methyltransferase [Acidobacteria bacterium]|nr:RNA methyltransferase [Acidobacteriota bacterium]